LLSPPRAVRKLPPPESRKKRGGYPGNIRLVWDRYIRLRLGQRHSISLTAWGPAV
jgi:hypothetical protein